MSWVVRGIDRIGQSVADAFGEVSVATAHEAGELGLDIYGMRERLKSKGLTYVSASRQG